MFDSPAFQNAVRAVVSSMLEQYAQPRWGFVTSVNPSSSGDLVKLRLEPESTAAGQLIETGWLPVIHPAAAGAQVSGSVPYEGAQALFMGENGFAEHGVVLGFAHNDGAQPPDVPNANGTGGNPSTNDVPRVAGEFLIVTPDGSVLRIGNGAYYMKPASGTVNIDGTLQCNGDVYDRHGSLDRLRGHHNSHVHDNVQNGGGSTNVPTEPGQDAE